MPKVSALILVALLLLTQPSHSAFENALQVAQPIETEEGIVISIVTVVKYLGDKPPGLLVPFTCEENCIVTESGRSENRNAAHILGIRTGVDPYHATKGGSLYGDTLKVFIDLREASGGKTPSGWSLDAVMEATLECVLYNAERTRTAYGPDGPFKAKHVKVDVLGADRFSALSKVYSFEALGELPRKSSFQY